MNEKISNLHQLVLSKNLIGLGDLLDERIEFYTPAVNEPLTGHQTVITFLGAALDLLVNDSFRYTRSFEGDASAVLEFESTVDGSVVNGVDILHWNSEGLIDEFRVMVRPVSAASEFVSRVHEDAMAKLTTANQTK